MVYIITLFYIFIDHFINFIYLFIYDEASMSYLHTIVVMLSK